MIIATIILIVFVILVIEIPFHVFFNCSIDRVLLEYELESPIKTRGYAYVKNGELFHGSAKKEMKGGVDTGKLIKLVSKLVIVKSCHIRGILGEEDVKNAIFESVVFQNLSSVILSAVHANNSTADISQSYCVNSEEDTNIFLQTAFWLSISDMIIVAGWYLFEKIINRS